MPQIRLLVRHCQVDAVKSRPDWFDKEKAFQDLLGTVEMEPSIELTVMFDGDPTAHFIKDYDVDVVRFDAGSDAASFRKCLQFAASQRGWNDDDIIYFLEDDYIHKPRWPTILWEGFENPDADMVSLYDHKDRYTRNEPPCKVTVTKSSHWRSATSTTNTFAVKYRVLLEDMDVHLTFALEGIQTGHHRDHEKFVALAQAKGRTLFTSIPGYSTHCEKHYLSPIVAWP